jgi:hypothetical protein
MASCPALAALRAIGPVPVMCGRLPVIDRDCPEQLLAREPAPPYAVHLALRRAAEFIDR